MKSRETTRCLVYLRSGDFAGLAPPLPRGYAVDHALVRSWGNGVGAAAPRVWKWRSTATLVALVFSVFTSGMAATGIAHQTGWLIRSREPFIKSGASEAAHRAMSTNNPTQIGRALSAYEELQKTLPPGGFFDAVGTPLHSWMTALLPYLEEQELYDRIAFDLPWDASLNVPIFQTSANAFMQPATVRNLENASLSPADYAGNALVLGGERRLTCKAMSDGTASTIMAGEVVANPKPWGNPTNWRDLLLGINKDAAGFGSPSPGGANFLFADGSVRFLKNTINPRVLEALSTPSGGEMVSSDSY